jgi:hypothetical protein
MPKYDLIVEQLTAHLINAANVADTGTWPIWIVAITATGNGTWVVETAGQGAIEIQDGSYVGFSSDDSPMYQISSDTIDTKYTLFEEEE